MLKKIIWIAVGLVLTVGLTMGIVHYTSTGERSMETSMSQVGDYLSDNADIMLSKYKQGAAVSGEELRDLIRSKPSAVTVKVQTGVMKAAAANAKPAVAFTSAQLDLDKRDEKYINPFKTFKCTASDTDSNGNITSLTFIQE